MTKIKEAIVVGVLLAGSSSFANICGTDFQNFNPTTNGLDFVTVQSSETLKPCIINLGLFLNYAANTLSYSQSYVGSQNKVGDKANDRILGADASLGIGLTKDWDVGITFPFMVSQEIKDTTGATYYDRRGLTEVKLNTKYRFSGDDSGGFAGIFSVNNNLIQDNPFSGSGSGPTLNFELAADTTYKQWAVGANVGYRKRSPGETVANQPFLPLKDQWIYSLAGSYLIKSNNTKVIGEIFGSQAVNKVDYDANRSLNALEWLGGVKHDFSNNLAVHVGLGTQLANSIGSPDWRVYTGVNWAFGPVCGKSEDTIEKVEIEAMRPLPVDEIKVVNETGNELTPPLDEERFEGKLPIVYRFNAEVFFDFNSDKIKTLYVPEIENLIRDLAKDGFKRLQIDGHTDSIGGDGYNLDLSQRRAASVKKYIVDKYHAIPERVITRGFGERRPIADNGNYQGRKKNRRVEFRVWK